MRSRRRYDRVVSAAALALVAVAGGCGVSTSAPTDHGDGLPAVARPGELVRPVPRPNEAGGSVERLVELFLKAPVGGGEAVQAFLTENALKQWQEPVTPQNPQLTVVRILSGPTPGLASGGRTPVTVTYQVVGVLNEGRVGELSQPGTGSMTFWVVPDEANQGNPRIDQIDPLPSGLLLSDDALDDIYRIQPVYFWDADYELLVPDLRYLPLTIGEEQRATRLVQWLLAGPSPWLTGAQGLATSTSLESVVISNGTFVVNLKSDATDAATLTKLQHQLQWTLSFGSQARTVELRLNGQPQQASSDDAREFNRAWAYRESRSRYDIVDQRVRALGSADPPILGGPENQSVDKAAINREGTAAALVCRTADGRRQLRVIRANAESVASQTRADMSRPSWVPVPGSATGEHIMLASGGRIYLASTADATFTNVTPSRVDGVSAVAVAPDGRRVAFVADGVAYVASLTVEGDSLTVGSSPRAVLSGQVAATGVAWLSETWLYVGGTAIGQSAPAIWRVTADGVVAHNESANLRGAPVAEIVTAPVWPADRPAGVFIYTPSQGVYEFGTVATETGLNAPFFGG